jgi:hypothetical protein
MASGGAVTSLLIAAATGIALVILAIAAVRARHLHLWLGSYIRQSLEPRPRGRQLTHIFVCVCDHYEPAGGRAEFSLQQSRVDTWVRRYPMLSDRHRDWLGRPPQHTFFYPEEEYHPEHLDKLAELCRRGYGDVEVHLHHHNETSQGLREKLIRYATTLHDRHHLLHRDSTGRLIYGFIHGNWALDNSAAAGVWCGVNDELIVLRDTGCYADFTFPSAPSETQPRMINSIYYATDDPLRPKSHDRGVPVVAGGRPQGDLLLIQGPLSLSWRSRKWGLLPRIENGDLSGDNPPSPDRVRAWVSKHVHVRGRPDWVFVKLHTHGAQERNMEALLGPAMNSMLDTFEREYNDGQRFRTYYVTAYEMYRLVKAAEANEVADPAAVLGGGSL